MQTFKRKDRGDIIARYDTLELAKRMFHVPLQKIAKLVLCVGGGADDDRQIKIMSESKKIGIQAVNLTREMHVYHAKISVVVS